MDAKPFAITVQEYNAFHAMDRALFSVLAIDLWRDPCESIQVLAFWLWIERQGFKRLVLYLLSLHPSVLTKYADEAVTCLRLINKRSVAFPPEASVIPLTTRFLKDKISPEYFQENRRTAVKEIHELVTGVCSRALIDLVEDAVKKHTAYDTWSKSYDSFGFVGEPPRNIRRYPPELEERTMFITFSRGYPLSEEEVRGFFNGLYGECIEDFHMQVVERFEQPLYARIVFDTPEIVDNILNGESKAKFTINGKHLWVRKFVAKY